MLCMDNPALCAGMGFTRPAFGAASERSRHWNILVLIDDDAAFRQIVNAKLVTMREGGIDLPAVFLTGRSALIHSRAPPRLPAAGLSTSAINRGGLAFWRLGCVSSSRTSGGEDE